MGEILFELLIEILGEMIFGLGIEAVSEPFRSTTRRKWIPATLAESYTVPTM